MPVTQSTLVSLADMIVGCTLLNECTLPPSTSTIEFHHNGQSVDVQLGAVKVGLLTFSPTGKIHLILLDSAEVIII